DRLDRKTTHVPAKRPVGVWPPTPFDPRTAWRLSAIDALTKFKEIRAWTVEEMLFKFEEYNGFGYRPHGILSPYVWNYSQFYSHGGFPCDRCWSDTYVSRQAGAGVIVRSLSQVDGNEVNLVYET